MKKNNILFMFFIFVFMFLALLALNLSFAGLGDIGGKPIEGDAMTIMDLPEQAFPLSGNLEISMQSFLQTNNIICFIKKDIYSSIGSKTSNQIQDGFTREDSINTLIVPTGVKINGEYKSQYSKITIPQEFRDSICNTDVYLKVTTYDITTKVKADTAFFRMKINC